jgi:hypothetical protein
LRIEDFTTLEQVSDRIREIKQDNLSSIGGLDGSTIVFRVDSQQSQPNDSLIAQKSESFID